MNNGIFTHIKEIFSVDNILYSFMGIGGVLGTIALVYAFSEFLK